jgi:hypothetical protein
MFWRSPKGDVAALASTLGDVNMIKAHIWRRRCVMRATFGYCTVFAAELADVNIFVGHIKRCNCDSGSYMET